MSQISVSVLSIHNFINFKVITSNLRKDNIVYCCCTALIMILIITQAPSHSSAAKPWLLTYTGSWRKKWMKKVCPKEMAKWKCTCSVNQISIDQSHYFLFVLYFFPIKPYSLKARTRSLLFLLNPQCFLWSGCPRNICWINT